MNMTFRRLTACSYRSTRSNHMNVENISEDVRLTALLEQPLLRSIRLGYRPAKVPLAISWNHRSTMKGTPEHIASYPGYCLFIGHKKLAVSVAVSSKPAELAVSHSLPLESS